MDEISRDNLFSLTAARGTSLPNPSTSHGVRPTSPPVYRLDITQLVPVVQDLFTARLAPSSRKACKLEATATCTSNFARLWRKYYCYSLVTCTRQSSLISTIKSYLTAIHYGNWEWHGQPWNHFMTQVEYVLKGAKKATPKRSRRHLLPY